MIAYACGDKDYSIEVPADSMVRERSNRMFHFRLDPNNPRERKALDTYKSFSRGIRNSAIKNIIRMYMDSANFVPYVSDLSALPSGKEKQKQSSEIQAENIAETVNPVPRMSVADPVSEPATEEPFLEPSADEYQLKNGDGPNIFDWFDENLG